MNPVTSASNGLQQASLAAAVRLAVARKALDAARQQGSAAVRLIESARTVAGGERLAPGDALVAAATGLGGLVDTLA